MWPLFWAPLSRFLLAPPPLCGLCPLGLWQPFHVSSLHSSTWAHHHPTYPLPSRHLWRIWPGDPAGSGNFDGTTRASLLAQLVQNFLSPYVLSYISPLEFPQLEILRIGSLSVWAMPNSVRISYKRPGALGKNSLLTNEQSVAKTNFPTSQFCATIK
jgi:hypothetical protein